MTVKRLDHVGIIVDDLDAAVDFFVELGLEVEGKTFLEGEWMDQVLGLTGVQSDVAVVRTPDGRSRIELSTFRAPEVATAAPWAPVNTPGIPRLTFVVDDLHDTLGRLRRHGAELVGEVAQYEQYCLFCYVRGPEGVQIGLIEPI